MGKKVLKETLLLVFYPRALSKDKLLITLFTLDTLRLMGQLKSIKELSRKILRTKFRLVHYSKLFYKETEEYLIHITAKEFIGLHVPNHP